MGSDSTALTVPQYENRLTFAGNQQAPPLSTLDGFYGIGRAKFSKGADFLTFGANRTTQQVQTGVSGTSRSGYAGLPWSPIADQGYNSRIGHLDVKEDCFMIFVCLRG